MIGKLKNIDGLRADKLIGFTPAQFLYRSLGVIILKLKILTLTSIEKILNLNIKRELNDR